MLNFEKWFYTNEKLIEEGLSINPHALFKDNYISNVPGVSSNTRRVLFDFNFVKDNLENDLIYLTTGNREWYFGSNIKNLGRNKDNDIASLYAPYIVRDFKPHYVDDPVPFNADGHHAFGDNSINDTPRKTMHESDFGIEEDDLTHFYNSILPLLPSTSPATNYYKKGKPLTTPLYHALKLGYIDTTGVITSAISDIKTLNKYTTHDNLEFLKKDDVVKFIKTGCIEYKKIIDRKNIKFDYICYPQSKSDHVKHITDTMIDVLSGTLDNSTAIKIDKKSAISMYTEYVSGLSALDNFYTSTINSLPSAIKDGIITIANGNTAIVDAISSNISTLSGDLIDFGKKVISPTLYDNTSTYIANAIDILAYSNQTKGGKNNNDNTRSSAILVLLLAWISELYKYNYEFNNNPGIIKFLSSAADIRTTCITIKKYLDSKITTKKSGNSNFEFENSKLNIYIQMH